MAVELKDIEQYPKHYINGQKLINNNLIQNIKFNLMKM